MQLFPVYFIDRTKLHDRKRMASWVHYRDTRYRIRYWYPDIGISDIVPDIVPDIGVTIPNIGTPNSLPNIIPYIGVTVSLYWVPKYCTLFCT